MRKRLVLALVVSMALAGLSGCGGATKETLTVTGGEPIVYQCENGEEITARYYSLSDNSLDFVKLSMPDGQEYTLPQVLSASGVRYTDDRVLVWWTKGDSAFAQSRDDTGEWQTTYEDCQQIAR